MLTPFALFVSSFVDKFNGLIEWIRFIVIGEQKTQKRVENAIELEKCMFKVIEALRVMTLNLENENCW
jgi:hypothetical protein